jgi:hypothetical protein
MNRTERAYSDILELRKRAGEILEWAFEPEKFRLADKTWFCPDFRVILKDETVEFHEIKGGFTREDAWIKLKIAAELHPYRFLICKLIKNKWEIIEV